MGRWIIFILTLYIAAANGIKIPEEIWVVSWVLFTIGTIANLTVGINKHIIGDK